MNLIQPSYLTKGDKIAIVATARKVTKEELQPAVDILKGWGLEVEFGKNLFHADNQFSGTDEERAFDLQTMFDDTTVKAVIVARGGYGTVRIIDKIDFTKFQQHPKWVIGYSDVTVLHAHIHNLGIETLHATMPINFIKSTEATESLRKALVGEAFNYTTPPFLLNRKGTANAPLVGGNLSLLYSLMGSSSEIDTSGKILFIEDLDEYLYHIDRMVVALKRAGKFAKLAGLVVGGMTEMKDNIIPFGKTAEEIIFDAIKQYNYPVFFNFPAGHINRNLALYFGRNSTLNVNKNGAKLNF